MTRPQIRVLDLNMSYSITPTAVNEDFMTAWFRFERFRYETFLIWWVQGTFGGNSGNNLLLPPVSLEAVEFSSNEWIFTDAFADTMEVERNPNYSIWFNLIFSRIGIRPQSHLGIPVYTGWVLPIVVLVLRDGWGLRGFNVVVWEVIITKK